ncbi:uncharacterized protein PADG_00036 [Paracoccidioides brasiliensis Pb18]|uniref:Uncharacterized protein n=1 Tax=Paracoccidioides brasiliensis (strain Pb18) TaxID=502780 RepID=C1FZJ6_PARBD|nr:uncharacterized protein PADG_00036 [Paracoccidioides brasiliensis Pb18]EEH43747.2 hypothetical protein PADG_00036 [Paracoccidioides brasiliensis Pb18]
MYMSNPPPNSPSSYSTILSLNDQRGRHFSDATSLKKRKRDIGNWDSQINDSMGKCAIFMPGNAQHIEEKFKDGYVQFVKESSLGAATSKFAAWPCPERRAPHIRPRLQPGPMKRRRLLQQQQQGQQGQQLPDWNAIPTDLPMAQKHHFYNTGIENVIPVSAATSISKLSPPHYRTKFNMHGDYPTTLPLPVSGLSQPQTNKTASRSALSPCHICHRCPTTRTILDAYADCDLCAERTCYICLRKCMSMDCNVSHSPSNPSSGGRKDDNEVKGPGWRENTSPFNSLPRHEGQTSERIGRKVCSWCAVEGVTEGGDEVVRCLACVAGW